MKYTTEDELLHISLIGLRKWKEKPKMLPRLTLLKLYKKGCFMRTDWQDINRVEVFRLLNKMIEGANG